MKKVIDEILDRIKTLPPMSEVAGKILRISDDPTISAKEIIDIIKYDQNITANVLRLCNSSYYSLPKKVSSLNDAVVFLGNKNLFNLVLAGISSSMLGKENRGYFLEKGKLWEHSVSSATLSKEIAVRVKYENEQLAYNAGLLHDTGKVILDTFMTQKHDEIMKKMSENKVSFNKIEEEIVGLSHAEVGALLAERWQFPEQMINGIRYHHTPEDAKEDKELVSIVHIADALSVMFGFGSGIDGLSYHLSDNALETLGIEYEKLYELLPILITNLKKAKEMLAV